MTNLSDIEKLLDAKFLNSRSKLSPVLEREQELRASLSKLSDMEADTTGDGKGEMRAIGADVVWRGWVARTRTKLNMELAQLLAQKEVLLHGVRKDFGKRVVSQELAKIEVATLKSKASKRALAASIQSSLFLQRPR